MGIAGTQDYSYTDLLIDREVLSDLGIKNEVIAFNGGLEWPKTRHLALGLQFFTLQAMRNAQIPKDANYINKSYDSHMAEANRLMTNGEPLLARRLLQNIEKQFKGLKSLDTLKETDKTLRRSNLYKTQKREYEKIKLKESFTREDYAYYLEEDLRTYNYNNLGWWKFQMDELRKLAEGSNEFEKDMASRLKGYLTAWYTTIKI